MSATLSGSVSLSSAISISIAPGTGLASYTIPVNPSKQTSYTDGSGANGAHRAYQATLTLVSSTPQVLDLTAVVCADASVGFSHVREVLVFNDGTADVTLDNASNVFQPWLSGTTPGETVYAGGSMYRNKPLGTNGWVVDSTHKLITVNPGSSAGTVRVVILGD